jgi:hypothetical protein
MLSLASMRIARLYCWSACVAMRMLGHWLNT